MGWPSYLEDITERYAAVLDQVRVDIQQAATEVTYEQRERIIALLCRGEAMLAEARAHLDLATDPAINLAVELDLSRDEVRELKHKLAAYETTCHSLAKTVRERDSHIRDLESEVKQLKAANSALARNFEKAFAENPRAAYEAFTDPSKAKKFKPEL